MLTLFLNQLAPSEFRRQLVEDWRTGGSLHLNPPEADPQPVQEEEVEAEEVVVKQEPVDESEERIKGNPGLSARIAEAKARLDGVGGGEDDSLPVGELDEEEFCEEGGAQAEEYSENRPVKVKQEVMVKQEAQVKQEQLAEDDGREFKREPGLCTPTSSGYWSDDSGSSGPYFGKLNWESQGRGVVVMVTNEGEERRVPVAAIDVKCGAETGDLVEFSLGPAHTDLSGQVVRAATRVKLVEKGIPTSEQDQIRGQEALKRSLAGLQVEDGVKRARMEEVIDVRSASFGDYSDIADMADEQEEEEDEDAPPVEQLYSHCICTAGIPGRCTHCPFYFLEASVERRLLPGETVTMPARVEGNQGELRRQLNRARLIPFPFKFLAQPSFDLLRRVGRGSLVGRVVGVREEEKVLATVQNLKGEGAVVREGDVLGICQEDLAESSEEVVQDVPVIVSQGDLVRDDRGVYCGFVRLDGEADFQYRLLRLELEPELAKRFKLLQQEVTVQTRASLWVELEARNGKSSLSKYLGKTGRLATASDVLLDVEETLSSNNNTSASSHPRRSKQESQNAYEAMLAQIDQDIACGNPVVQAPMKASMMSRVFKGVVGQQLVIPQGGSAITNLFLVDDEITNLKCLLKARVVVSNNEEFKYYNNCYDIPEQAVQVTNGICRASRTTRPCVKVTVTNPRTGTACLKTDSPVALVKLEQAKPQTPVPVHPPALPTVSQLPSSVLSALQQPQQVQQKPARPDFSAPRHLERLSRKVARRWEQLVGQNLWEHSLTVEDRFPYFSRGKMKTPFGLNDKELNVRVGLSQSSRPVKVLDRVNGVFTCAICDVVVLDKYACQDHWYSAQHKGTMAKLQAIAGPDERVAMNRAVATELVNQWNLSPLMGLDRVVEVIQGRREPYYHCQICRIDSSLAELGPHLAAPSHVLSFLKALLPSAWARFAPSPDPTRWTELDFTVLEQVVTRVDAQHGGKRIAIASSVEQLPEVLARLTSSSYSGKGLDSFFRSLPPAEVPQVAAPMGPVGDKFGRVLEADAALAEAVEVSAGAKAEVAARLLGTFPDGLAGRWVVVGQGKGGGDGTSLSVQHGVSKLWLDEVDKLCVRLTLENCGTSQLHAKEHAKMATVRWRE